MTTVRIMSYVKEGCKELFELGQFEFPCVPEDYDKVVVDEREYRVTQRFMAVATSGDDPLIVIVVKRHVPFDRAEYMANKPTLEKVISKVKDVHWNAYYFYTPLTLITLYLIHRFT